MQCLAQHFFRGMAEEWDQKNLDLKVNTRSKDTIVVTGFGPFSVHKKNPSWLAVKELSKIGFSDDIDLVIKKLPVEYKAVKREVPKLWEVYKPKLVVHCGVSGLAQSLTLEQTAHNKGYERMDNEDQVPEENCCCKEEPEQLDSRIDMSFVCEGINNLDCGVQAVVSRDAGRYLCDYTYFISLSIDRNRAAFIHVPPENQPYSLQKIAEGLRTAIYKMLEQLRDVDDEL